LTSAVAPSVVVVVVVVVVAVDDPSNSLNLIPDSSVTTTAVASTA
jgi:hypothetical protein